MKAITTQDAIKFMEKQGCVLIRKGNHTIYKNIKTNQIFSLPIAHKTVSSGVVRKMFKFCGRN